LLRDTGLTYRFVNSRMVAIRGAGEITGNQPDSVGSETSSPAATLNDAKGGQKRSFWERFRLAQADEGQAGQSSAVATSPGSSAGAKLEEIVVTAQKREESLQSVPVPVSVINAQRLTDTGLTRLQDYFTSIPAVNLRPGIQSIQVVSIRGITTGVGNPVTGFVVDDAPFGSSTAIGGGTTAPDIDPADLERIEVLRGPQGTLYGASSMGGLIKFVTRDPSFEAPSGRLQVGVNGVKDSTDIGRSLRGSLNVPLTDTLAVRASAFTRHDAGYVDNVQTGESDVNDIDAHGGRLSLLWQPSDAGSLRLNALAQRIESDGSPSIDTSLGGQRQSRLAGTGWYDRNVQAYSAVATVHLGRADVVSITGYNVFTYEDSLDVAFIGSLVNGARTNFGVGGAALLTGSETRKFTQELRLSAPLGQKFELLLGAFYADEDSLFTDRRIAVDPATGAMAGQLALFRWPTTYEEKALFADLTFRATDRLDIQFGARQSAISPSFTEISTNVAGGVTVVPESVADADPFTYLVTPRFRLTPEVMLYARFASGFRSGSANINPGGVVPAKYAPDKTQNYEIGAKGDFFAGRLTLDASLYRIDWKDIQIGLLSPASLVYTANAGSARSQGVELSWAARALSALRVTGWVAWNDAELSEDFPTTSTAVGRSGDRLPYSARFSGNLAIEQGFPAWSGVDGFAAASVSYLGERTGRFRPVAQRYIFPAFTQLDLRAGVRSDAWTATVFVNNVTDERGQLYGGLGENVPLGAFTFIQPRTFGLSLGRSF
jgi:iron complex outermembrane recepter protein